MRIYLKGVYTILGNIRIDSESKDQRFGFEVFLEKNKPPVTVDIIPNEKIVESFDEVEVSEEIWSFLQKDTSDLRDLSELLEKELSKMTSNLSLATRKVLKMIKYHLYQEDLKTNLFSSKNRYWSTNKTEWKDLPHFGLSCSARVVSAVPLKEDTAKIIQGYLGCGQEPFLGLVHLQRAETESENRFKWIDATIAAELAIKEFLIKFKPDIEKLLLAVPSPPLHKLYGSILEDIAGEKSPKKKEIAKGVEKRNILIHSPEKINISNQEAINYINDVKIAIYHLLHLLNPADSFIKNFLRNIGYHANSRVHVR